MKISRTTTLDFFYFAIILLSLMFGFQQCKERKAGEAEASHSILSLRDSIHYVTLSDGSRAAEKRSTEISKEDFEAVALRNRDSVRQLKERIGSLSRLTRSLRVELNTKDTVIVPVHDTLLLVRYDTVRAGKVGYADKWLTLDGLLMNDSLRLNYAVRANLDIATYWKSDGLLRPRYLAVNIHSRNPHLTVTGIEDYHLLRPKRRFYQTNAFHLAAGLAAGLLLSL